ncbi:MAG: hypothetical protein K8R68_11245, partial [Bacteroidales bacterium]|nr:hypothetical protein [Bacteroidales bacterium]
MKKTSIKIFILFALLFCISQSSVFTQDINDIGSLPEQVDLVTGTPIIRIPLWEAQDRDITIPIALNYNATGIRVAQTASWVGLGWNLNVGGVISREVKGLPDDIYIPEPNDIYDNEMYGWLFMAELYHPYGSEEHSISERVRDISIPAILSELISGFYFYEPGKNIDTEPDIYHFNFPGGSGKFVFEHDYCDINECNRKLLITPHQNLMISYSLNSITKEIDKFEIIDEAGYKYIFENKEVIYSLIIQNTNPLNPHFPDASLPYVYSFGNPNADNLHRVSNLPDGINSKRDYYNSESTKDIYTTAWHLTKIVSPMNSEANFIYETEIIENTEFTNKVFRSFREEDENLISSISVDTSTENFISRLETLRLMSVETENLLIEFQENVEERDDLPGDNIKALSKINIINKFTNPQSILREFEFSYTLFNDGYSNGDYLYDEDDGSYGAKRLKLNSIQEKNGSETYPPYIFDYYNDDGSYKLPNRFSYECDFWGFYNGNEANTFIPEIYFYHDLEDDFFRIYKIEDNTDFITFPGANRQPPIDDYDWMASIGMLTSVEFPNGGSVEYEYEPHSFIYKEDEYKGGGTRLKKIIISDNETSTQPTEVNYYYDNNGTTSGKVTALPTFGNYDPDRGKDNDETWPEFYNWSYIRHNYNNTNFTDRQVMYEKVTIDKANMGKTEYYFDIPLTLDYKDNEHELLTKIYRNTGDIDYPPSSCADSYFYSLYGEDDPGYDPENYVVNVFPYPKNIDLSWKRGNLLSLNRYQIESDGSYLPVQVVRYAYKDFYLNNIEPDTVYGIKVGFLKNCVDFPDMLYLCSKYSILTNVKNVLESKTEILYDKANPINTISTISEYNYNLLGQLAEVITTTKENTRINRITYNGEYECSVAGDDMTDALIKLQEKNILN